eukprot:Gb_04676 [translate_table: standard]
MGIYKQEKLWKSYQIERACGFNANGSPTLAASSTLWSESIKELGVCESSVQVPLKWQVLDSPGKGDPYMGLSSIPTQLLRRGFKDDCRQRPGGNQITWASLFVLYVQLLRWIDGKRKMEVIKRKLLPLPSSISKGQYLRQKTDLEDLIPSIGPASPSPMPNPIDIVLLGLLGDDEVEDDPPAVNVITGIIFGRTGMEGKLLLGMINGCIDQNDLKGNRVALLRHIKIGIEDHCEWKSTSCLQ